MINLHVFPATIANDSRLAREISTIESLELFTAIEAAGVSSPELPSEEPIGTRSTVRRLAAESDSYSLFARSGKTITFGWALYQHYRNEPLAVINCHSLSALPACIALKKATGARLVYDPHELETEASAVVGIRKPIFKFIERTGIRHVDHTFTVSESISQWYRARYGLVNIDTIYNFPSQEQVSGPTDRGYFRRKFDIPESHTIYLYQGILGEGRGIATAVEAFTNGLMPEASLVLLGYGPWEDKAREWMSTCEGVHFHEAVSPNHLSTLTRAADVGLAPTQASRCLSYYYSAPNKLFQYWRAGIPVIASALPEHRRFVERYAAGVLMDLDTAQSLALAAQNLKSIDIETIRDGLSRANEEIRWESYTDLFRERYSALVASGPLGGR